MKAHETRRGGRHVARERGADHMESVEPVELPKLPTVRHPLIDLARLDGNTLLHLMNFCGLTAAEFEKRYG